MPGYKSSVKIATNSDYGTHISLSSSSPYLIGSGKASKIGSLCHGSEWEVASLKSDRTNLGTFSLRVVGSCSMSRRSSYPNVGERNRFEGIAVFGKRAARGGE